MKNKYYALEVKDKEADVYIFGDITSWEWFENDVSSYTLSKELQELDKDIEVINVHINSYGGEVAEGLAIYNMLRSHKAKVRTIVDGFACSIASVIFMAGDERIMNAASLLMIHDAWMYTAGNAAQLRKDADDLEKITQASIEAYKSRVNISEEEIKELLDNETWILPSEALEMGFATAIVGEKINEKAAASAKKALFNLLKNNKKTPAAATTVNFPEEKINEMFEELKILKEKMDVNNEQKNPEPVPEDNKLQKFFNAILRKE